MMKTTFLAPAGVGRIRGGGTGGGFGHGGAGGGMSPGRTMADTIPGRDSGDPSGLPLGCRKQVPSGRHEKAAHRSACWGREWRGGVGGGGGRLAAAQSLQQSSAVLRLSLRMAEAWGNPSPLSILVPLGHCAENADSAQWRGRSIVQGFCGAAI